MPAIPDAPPSPSPLISTGQAIALFAFDIGYEVNLDIVRQILPLNPVQPLSRKKQTPTHLQYTHAPLIFHIGETPVFRGLTGHLQATIFDFGAVSISYRWPLPAALPLADLPGISLALFELNLEASARQQVEALLETIRPAIVRPELSALVEDFYLFILESLNSPWQADDLLHHHGPALAQVLRLDTEPLSDEQQADVLGKPISYYRRDLVLIDWNSALIYDSDYADTLNVLELLNVELLEARYMDNQLDKRIQQYDDLPQTRRGLPIPLYNPYRQAIRELAELRIESSLLAERVDNALKLIGDLYLARIYDTAAERFNMREWDAAISRKLDIIGNLYQVLTDRVNTAQAQTLEVIIILLIFLEIVLGFRRG